MQLGRGNIDDCLVPTLVEEVALVGKKITGVVKELRDPTLRFSAGNSGGFRGGPLHIDAPHQLRSALVRAGAHSRHPTNARETPRNARNRPPLGPPDP